jgi:hypothetical protein
MPSEHSASIQPNSNEGRRATAHDDRDKRCATLEQTPNCRCVLLWPRTLFPTECRHKMGVAVGMTSPSYHHPARSPPPSHYAAGTAVVAPVVCWYRVKLALASNCPNRCTQFSPPHRRCCRHVPEATNASASHGRQCALLSALMPAAADDTRHCACTRSHTLLTRHRQR